MVVAAHLVWWVVAAAHLVWLSVAAAHLLWELFVAAAHKKLGLVCFVYVLSFTCSCVGVGSSSGLSYCSSPASLSSLLSCCLLRRPTSITPSDCAGIDLSLHPGVKLGESEEVCAVGLCGALCCGGGVEKFPYKDLGGMYVVLDLSVNGPR